MSQNFNNLHFFEIFTYFDDSRHSEQLCQSHLISPSCTCHAPFWRSWIEVRVTEFWSVSIWLSNSQDLEEHTAAKPCSRDLHWEVVSVILIACQTGSRDTIPNCTKLHLISPDSLSTQKKARKLSIWDRYAKFYVLFIISTHLCRVRWELWSISYSLTVNILCVRIIWLYSSYYFSVVEVFVCTQYTSKIDTICSYDDLDGDDLNG